MAGLTSLPRTMNIKGQPHKLAYVTEAEGDLLKAIGGAGKPVQGTDGVPAFYMDADDAADMGGPDSDPGDPGGEQEAGYDIGFSAPAQEAAAAQAAAAAADASEASRQAAEEASRAQTAALSQAQRDAANLGLMSARSAAEKAAGLQDLMDMGIIGYNEAVERGFVEAVERAERDFDLALARDIAEKYGLDPSQITPAFMDPTGVKTMGYRGPGSTKAAATEMARGAATLVANLVEMYPSPLNMLSTIAREEFGLKMPSLGLTDKVKSTFDEMAASQKEANTPTGIIDDFEEEESEKGAFSSFASPIGFEAPESTYDYGFPDSGNLPLVPPIPSVPTVAPEPAAEVVRPPVTRTAATDTFSILAGIYGPDVAEKLLPTRTV